MCQDRIPYRSPPPDPADSATHGSDWNVVGDSNASGEKYLTIKLGLSSPQVVPWGEEAKAKISFKVTKDEKYSEFDIAHAPPATGNPGL